MARRRTAPRLPADYSGRLLANLAGAPFVNRRPVQRFTLAMWIAGVLLAALNAFLWLEYRQDSTTLRSRLAATRGEIETRSRDVVSMGEELGGLQLEAQNQQVEFLNQRIAERTFPWSLLFERIAATLPDGVRLSGLAPSFSSGSTAPGSRQPTPPREELVTLQLDGVAKSDEELYQLMDSLFASSSFEQPRLTREANDGVEVSFNIAVQYRPWLVAEESHRPAAATEDLEEGEVEDEVGDDAGEEVEEEDSTAGVTEDVETAEDGGPRFEATR
jgi:Tfp pilus assembly protein PilN